MAYRSSLTWTAMFAVMALMFVKLPPMVAKQDSVLNTYSALVEVDALARQRFVEGITDHRLVEGAIRGMMRQLDPYSGYISPEELPGFQRRMRGTFCGVGLEVGVRDGVMTVIAPIEGSPAARAGVLAGDQLLSIHDRDVERLSTFEVEEMLLGAPGTLVSLRLRSPGTGQTYDLQLAREHVAIQSVRGFRRLPDGAWDYWIDRQAGIGYMRVSNFRENTIEQFDQAITNMQDGPLSCLILDLRFNPGGFLYQAVLMADRFLSNGPILSTANRHGAMNQFDAQPSPSDVHARVIVLINSGSASSSEIVAGALQARGRATIVGERSFGKGSVQHLIHLVGQKGALKLTVAYYRLPDGRIIHRSQHHAATDPQWGVKPDYEVPLSAEETSQIQQVRMESRHESADDPAFLDRQLQAALSFAR